MWLERISGGAVDLVDLQAAKDHLRLLEDDFDAEVTAAISAASRHLDVDNDGFGGLGFPLIAQEWSTKSSWFSPNLLRLPFSRVTAVTEINFTAPDGSTGVVPVADYILVKRNRASVVRLATGASWPQLIEKPDAVDVRFTAGFADLESVPDDIIQAAKQLIGFYFHNRGGDPQPGALAEVQFCVDRLTARYRPFAI